MQKQEKMDKIENGEKMIKGMSRGKKRIGGGECLGLKRLRMRQLVLKIIPPLHNPVQHLSRRETALQAVFTSIVYAGQPTFSNSHNINYTKGGGKC